MAEDEAAVQPGAYAFRCRSCNHLEGPEAAGERAVPAACRICGAGVSWIVENGVPVKVDEPDNWLILADITGDGLADIIEHHGITPEEIVGHSPFATTWARGEDLTEIVTHACDVCALGLTDHREGAVETAFATQPVHNCKACQANRPGTRPHEEGRRDTVRIPTWQPALRELAAPVAPAGGKSISVEAREGSTSEDRA